MAADKETIGLLSVYDSTYTILRVNAPHLRDTCVYSFNTTGVPAYTQSVDNLFQSLMVLWRKECFHQSTLVFHLHEVIYLTVLLHTLILKKKVGLIFP